MFPRRPERLKSSDYIGPYAYFLTFCTDQKRRLFIDPEAVNLVGMQFVRTASERHFEITAYCFMPDHVHLVVQTTDEAGDVARFARLAKQYAGYAHSQEMGGRLWQPGWHDRLLRESDDLLTGIRYVLQNPIRAGLVREVPQYSYLGSGVLTREALLESVRL